MKKMKIKVLVLFLLVISISVFAGVSGTMEIIPSSPNYLDTLNCSFTLNDTSNVTLEWDKNGTFYSTVNFTNITSGYDSIGYKSTRSGENWTCKVTFNGTTINDTVTIGSVYSFDFTSTDSLPTLMNDFMSGYTDLFLALFSLGVVWFVGKTFSGIALSYSIITLALYFLLSSQLLLFLAIISLVVGLLLRLVGG